MFDLPFFGGNRVDLMSVNLKFELEYFPTLFLLLPGIYQFEETSVSPNPSLDFLINPNQLWRSLVIFVGLGRIPEQPVLSQCPGWRIFGLINFFWVWPYLSSRKIMPFIN